jgi:hypothetical protein
VPERPPQRLESLPNSHDKQMTGPRWALWSLRFIWIWFAVGAAGVLLFQLPQEVAALFRYRDPVAAGFLSGWVLLVACLRWTFRPLWPRDPGRPVTAPVRQRPPTQDHGSSPSPRAHSEGIEGGSVSPGGGAVLAGQGTTQIGGGRRIAVGALVIALLGVFPPWLLQRPGHGPILGRIASTETTERPAGMHFILAPPQPLVEQYGAWYPHVDYGRLLVSWAVVGLITTAATLVARRRRV